LLRGKRLRTPVLCFSLGLGKKVIPLPIYLALWFENKDKIVLYLA
jgi:hypothetical protein